MKIPPADVQRRRQYTVVALLALLAVVAWFAGPVVTSWVSRRMDGPVKAEAARALERLQAELAGTIATARRVEISGQATELGIAFAVAPGRVLARCGGAPAGSQYVITEGARNIPAPFVKDAGAGFCILELRGAQAGLPRSRDVPKPGDFVYAPLAKAGGEFTITAGTVKAAAADSAGTVLDVDFASRLAPGTPIVDADGKVVAAFDARTADGRQLARVIGSVE